MVDDAVLIASGISSKMNVNNQNSSISISIVAIPPESYVDDLCKDLSLTDDNIKVIKNILTQAVKKNPLLLEENPKKIASGAIRMFYAKSGISFNKISGKIGSSASVTKKYYDILSKNS